MTFRKVKTALRMPDAIVRQVENQILSGRLKADQRLPPEGELMRQFGVGRNSVREALRILETSGLIKVKQGSQGGPVVTKFTDEFVSDFLIKAIRLGGVSPDDLSGFRLALEPSIAEMVASKKEISAERLLQMEKNIAEVKKLFGAKEVTAYKNMDFHVLLASASENPMFIIILRTLRAGFNLISPPQNKIQVETIKYHTRILDAVKHRDPDGAREQMFEHLVRMREILQEGRVGTWGMKKSRRRPSAETIFCAD